MSITFVTAFLDLEEDRSKDKSFETCLSHFSKLASSGISLVVFISQRYMCPAIHAKNVYYIPIELVDLVTYKECTQDTFALPKQITSHHDTRNFMILMNSKIEFIKRAMDRNVFETTHFAWIDFSICHVFRNTQSSLDYLIMLSQTALPARMLVFPGCWNKGMGSSYLYESINWRFCGGFFLGDKTSLEHFYALYRISLPASLRETRTLVWEVNIWHQMELNGWNCTWYKADHNDSIIRIPSSFFHTVASLTTIPSRITTCCKRTIDSLLGQVDHIYLNVASYYKRFQSSITLPDYFQEEPYKSTVTVVVCEDKGPATKYLGALSHISEHSWIFFCDDDQEYAPDLLLKMKHGIDSVCIYQNRYATIEKDTSGGLIHGYVGNLGHASLFKQLPSFFLPDCAMHVDDQWMSIYCFLHNICIRPSGIEAYTAIFKRLEDGHECIGSDSLFSLGTRSDRVKTLAELFKVRFISNGRIASVSTT
jgi:hypothetical protein